MAEPKTKRNEASVSAFLERVSDEGMRRDARGVLEIMKAITRQEPAMWGDSIVGFGSYHYKYASGQEGDWPLLAFSPRKRDLTIYIMPGFEGHKDLLAKLGKHKTGKSCLYIRSLDDVHLPTLKTIIRRSLKQMATLIRRKTS